MPDPARELEEKALRLPTKARARLAHKLIVSLDGEPDPDAEELWAVEIERRVGELERGEVEEVPADEAFEHARRRGR